MAQYGGIAPLLSAGIAALLVAYLSLFPAAFALVVAVALRRFGTRALLLGAAPRGSRPSSRAHCSSAAFPGRSSGTRRRRCCRSRRARASSGVYGLSFLVVLASARSHGGVPDGIGPGSSRWDRRGARGVHRPMGPRAARGRAPDAHGHAGPCWPRAGERPAGSEMGTRSSRTKSSARYLALSRQAADRGARAILWPESSTPFYFEEQPEGRGHPAVRARARRLRAARQRRGGSPQPAVSYNSAFMVRPDGSTAAVYRKVRLVPFGEYVPFRTLLFFAAPLVEAVGGVRAGPGAGDAAARRQTGEHGHLLRSGVPCADSSRRAPGQHAADDNHERRLVRPFVGAVPALRDGVDARRSNRAAISRGPPTRASAASSIRTGA